MMHPATRPLLAVCAAWVATASGYAADTTAPAAPVAPDVVRTVDKPYAKPTLATVSAPLPTSAPTPPSTPASLPTVTPGPVAIPFELTLADADVRRAFERWARGFKALIWLLPPDLPIDAATGPITPHPADQASATQAQSADPALVAAMMKVARSFESSKTPFVIREYDNAIVVRPRAGSRP